MRNIDQKVFEAELRKLCAVIGKPFSPHLMAGFWAALFDVSLEEVQKNIDRYIRSATRETKFPKPADLRDVAPNASTVLRTAAMDEGFRQAEERSRRNWQELEAKDPELTRIDLTIAQCGRILAIEHPSSPQYAQALREDNAARDRRNVLLEERSTSHNDHRIVATRE